MRRALARLLGVFLTLALTSVVAIAALSALASRARLGSEPARASNRPALPLYLNAAPRNVHDLAQAAVRRLMQGASAEAEREISRLGGAALPHVLPNLDGLSPDARRRVAQALVPVARRMGVGADEDLSSAESAVVFWQRFWQDRSFDFRPQVVRRMVGRLAQKSNALRVEDILHLDTYSLSELIPALGRIKGAEDVRRAARLTLVLSHVTGRGPVVQPGTTVAQARSAVLTWQNFWLVEGPDFVTLDGPRRVVAAFAQTRYGAWGLHTLGVMRQPGAEVEGSLGLPVRLAVASALRVALALALALLLGALWTRLDLVGSLRLRFLARLATTLLVALPTAFVVVSLDTPHAVALREAFAILLSGALGSALVSPPARAIWNDLGPAALPTWPRLVRTLLTVAPSCLPWLLTSAFALELLLELQGAAPVVLASLARGDVGAGMSLSLGGSLLAVLLVSLADAAARQPALPAVYAPALVEVGGASSRRSWLLAIGTLVLFGLFGAGWSRSPGVGGWSAVADGARVLLGYGTLTVLVATIVGFALGAAAASGPNAVDGLLIRILEVGGGLPAMLWAAALSCALGAGTTLSLCLGLLRAIDVAWLLRSELLRRASANQDLSARSLGHLPLSIFVRQRLRPAALPALTAVALTPAWLLAIAVAGRIASLPASAGAPGWSLLLSQPLGAGALPRIAAVLMLSLLTWLLLSTVTSAPRRVGAARASLPPADGAI